MSVRIWLRAFEAMGPRQIIGSSSSTMKPIELISSPWALRGSIVLPSTVIGWPLAPSIVGWDGP